jgi:hypothetical protein
MLDHCMDWYPSSRTTGGVIRAPFTASGVPVASMIELSIP